LNSGQNDNSKREHNNKLIITWRSRASVSVTCNRSIDQWALWGRGEGCEVIGHRHDGCKIWV